ncbi:dipeptidase [Aliikangiella sp. IMCC44632]
MRIPKEKKILLLAVIVLVTAYLCVTFFAPTIIDKKYNQTVNHYPYSASAPAFKLYQSLTFIADLHSDALLWKRNLLNKHDYGHGDIPRMVEANIALQAFTIVNKVPKGLNFNQNHANSDIITSLFMAQGRPIKSWFGLAERVLAQSAHLHAMSLESEGKFHVIRNTQQLNQFIQLRAQDKSHSAGFLGIEGAQALEGKLSNLELFYDAGIRMIGLTHFFDNELGGSAHGVSKSGLTPFGRKAVLEMQRRDILVDLSHASPQMIDDVLAIATKPVIVSHTGVKGTCNNRRNLSDNHLKAIAKNGGLIGIAMFKQAVCGNDPKAIANAIVYTKNLIGVSHVALGSDFDGSIKAIVEVRGLVTIVDELLKLGVTPKEIELIMGGNIRHFLLNNLPNQT